MLVADASPVAAASVALGAAAGALQTVPLACIVDEGSMDAIVSEACRRARLPKGCADPDPNCESHPDDKPCPHGSAERHQSKGNYSGFCSREPCRWSSAGQATADMTAGPLKTSA